MSIHVSPFYSGFSSRAPAGEIISAGLIDGGGDGRPADAQVRAPAEDRLSIRLDTIGMVISLAARDPDTPAMRVAVASEPGAPGEIELHFTEDGIRHDIGTRPALQDGAGDDPLVRTCSRALSRLEGRQDEFAGLYADALRLAIVTRMLGLQARPQPEVPPAEPAARPARSGLPRWRFKRVAAYVEENIGEAITLADMAAAAGLSRMHFAAQFRIATGIRPHEYVMRRRIEHAQQMLRETRSSLVEIALSVGFQTQAHFTTVFRRFVGDTPRQWRSANCATVRV